jgi:uncharacterized protein
MPAISSLRSRIEVIDVLRGFTLLGIIITHTIEQYYAGPMPDVIASAQNKSIIDGIVEGLCFILIAGKFYMIFSFLFGLSFFIQFDKSNTDNHFLVRFSWRLLILLGIGMVHHMHYRGDILSIYALLGFGLLFTGWLSNRAILFSAAFLIFNIPSFIYRVTIATELFPAQDQTALLEYYNTVKSGSYLEILTQNLYSFKDKMMFQLYSGRIFITYGLFLLGVYVGRIQLFSQIENYLPFIKKLRNLAWRSLAIVVFLALVLFGGAALLKIELPGPVNFGVGFLMYDIFNTSLAIIYVAAILLLFQKEKWNRRLMVFYEVGRTGLTTYVMQSGFGMLIFFNVGLGLLNELGASIALLIAVALFVVQILFARMWLGRYHYGIFEWVWRSLTFLKIQPMIKKSALAAGA